MPGFILVVDDQDRIAPIVEAAVHDANVRVVSVPGFAAAKRKLIQAAPNLIISAVSVKDEPPGSGYKFCRELKQHSELLRIPILLVTDNMTGDSIRTATEAGANGLMPWPMLVPGLRTRIAPLLPELMHVLKTEVEGGTAPQPPPTMEQSEQGEKLQLAQRLLAQVLHNLKTSDLLQIADLDDVPRVVSEMTKKVCGISDSAAGNRMKSAAATADPASKETSMDLDTIFKLK